MPFLTNRMDTLAKLFGSKDIVKMLRLFILNPSIHFDFTDVVTRTKVERDTARRELHMLERIGFLKRRTFYKEIEKIRGKQVVLTRKRTSGYTLDEQFTHLPALRLLVAGNAMVSERELAKKLTKAGRLKLVVLSGIFVGDVGSRVDLLVVGDQLRRGRLESVIRDFETEVGKEISFAAFSTHDFKYRLSMQDRLLRDMFDFEHSTVIDRLGIDHEPALAMQLQ